MNILKINWNMRYEEVKDNPDRLLHLMNDFFLAHKFELDHEGYYWFQNFYERLHKRYEEVCDQIAV